MKIILSLFLLIPLIGLTQDIEFNALENFVSDSLDDSDFNGFLESNVDVTNLTNNEQNLFVRFEILSQEPEEIQYKIEWLIDWDFSTTETDFGQLIQPGETIFFGWDPETNRVGFSGEYQSEETGTTIIRHFFFDNETGVEEYFDIQYCLYDNDIECTDIINNVSELDSELLSAPYPNPANDIVNIDYNYVDITSSCIIITNILGEEIIRETIRSKEGTISLNISTFDSGIYFYSLVTQDEILSKEKFVVSH